MRLSSRIVTLLLLVVTGAATQQQQNPEEYAKFLEGAERVRRMLDAQCLLRLAYRGWLDNSFFPVCR